VIWGHGRIEAARQAGLKEIPVEVLTGLSDADKQALRIADNAVGEQSGWDMELLAKELESLSQADYQLELLALDVDLLEGLGDVLDPGVLTEGGGCPPPTAFNTPTPIDAIEYGQVQYNPVTEGDISSEQDYRESEFKSKDQKLQDVVCPHCGESFYVND